MIAARLLQRIEASADSIAQSVIDGRRRNPDMPNYRNLSDDESRTPSGWRVVMSRASLNS
jgi:hypothetical protein